MPDLAAVKRFVARANKMNIPKTLQNVAVWKLYVEPLATPRIRARDMATNELMTKKLTISPQPTSAANRFLVR